MVLILGPRPEPRRGLPLLIQNFYSSQEKGFRTVCTGPARCLSHARATSSSFPGATEYQHVEGIGGKGYTFLDNLAKDSFAARATAGLPSLSLERRGPTDLLSPMSPRLLAECCLTYHFSSWRALMSGPTAFLLRNSPRAVAAWTRTPPLSSKRAPTRYGTALSSLSLARATTECNLTSILLSSFNDFKSGFTALFSPINPRASAAEALLKTLSMSLARVSIRKGRAGRPIVVRALTAACLAISPPPLPEAWIRAEMALAWPSSPRRSAATLLSSLSLLASFLRRVSNDTVRPALGPSFVTR